MFQTFFLRLNVSNMLKWIYNFLNSLKHSKMFETFINAIAYLYMFKTIWNGKQLFWIFWNIYKCFKHFEIGSEVFEDYNNVLDSDWNILKLLYNFFEYFGTFINLSNILKKIQAIFYLKHKIIYFSNEFKFPFVPMFRLLIMRSLAYWRWIYDQTILLVRDLVNQ